MNPRLVAISGPQSGSTFPLTGEDMVIGRDSSNWVCITDPSSSRKHCVFFRNGNEFSIKDLESRNGTFVNSIPIRERVLQDGDKIDVGDSSFLFLSSDGKGDVFSNGFSDLGLLTTTRMRIEDSPYLNPQKTLSVLPLTERISRGLETVFEFSRAAAGMRDAGTLMQKLLESAMKNVPAERASVSLLSEETNEIISVHARNKNLDQSEFPMSRTVLRLITQDRIALLSNDILQDPNLGSSAQSLVSTKVHSLIAVPLIAMDKLSGILYIDTSDTKIQFDEGHLELVSALANIGAVALENIKYSSSLLQDQNRLLEDLRSERSIVGESSALLNVLSIINKVSRTDSTVLICGDSGTGKELAARAIHLNSPRSTKPFVAINCANLSETLLESELFGHEKGAFTGAYEQKKGKLERAEGGTVFLDEISELASSLQARILRVLQEREFERVGGNRTIKTDIRLVAATNKNLEDAIRTGKFREDLFYRLNVIAIVMPPLRERREDIPLLAAYFASKHGKKCGRKIMGISPEARKCLENYDWPGNVRQLENVIERAIVLGTDNLIRVEDLTDEIVDSVTLPSTKYQDLLRQSKRKMIVEALEQAKGNHTEAANILGVHPNNLRRMIATLKVKSN